MSPSNASDKLTFDVQASDSTTEIFVINGELQLVDRGVGRLTTKPLDPGIYKIKARAGSEVREQYLVLRSPGQRVLLPPFAFASAAPLDGTSKTHEYQMGAAQAESQNVHSHVGQGSWIFIFSREWTPPDQPGTTHSTNPAAGLSLRDGNGSTVADLGSAARVDMQAADPWAACNVELDPGQYRLSLALPSGARLEQTVVACPGWQTQLFLLQRDYADSRRADLAKAAAFMTQGGGFHPGDAHMREAELARLGLSNARKVMSSELRQILEHKFDNPMLGIFGAHLLLLEQTPDLGLVRTVAENLANLLGYPHPDVEALALAAGNASATVFAIPPMLRRSWSLIVNATIERPELVPADSLAARAGQNLGSEEPWLIWNESAAATTAADGNLGSDLAAALLTQASTPPRRSPEADSPFAAIRRIRAALQPELAKSLGVPLAQQVVADVSKLDLGNLGRLVRTLGIPRSSLEDMLKAAGSNAAASDAADRAKGGG